MRIHDTIIGVFLMLFGGFILWQTSGFPQMPGQAIGPASFPTVLALIFLGGGAIVVIKGWRSRQATAWVVLEKGWFEVNRLVPVLVAIIGTLLLAGLFEQIGFLAGGSLLLIALYFTLGYRSVKWLAISVVFIGVVYYGMAKVLLVPLPLGILG